MQLCAPSQLGWRRKGQCLIMVEGEAKLALKEA